MISICFFLISAEIDYRYSISRLADNHRRATLISVIFYQDVISNFLPTFFLESIYVYADT